MIGSGIFIVSAEMGRLLGSPGWLLVAWLLTGVLTVAAALSYGELAAMMPRAGGQYVYLREAFSPLWGFLYGWTFLLVIQAGTSRRSRSPSPVSPASCSRSRQRRTISSRPSTSRTGYALSLSTAQARCASS